MKRIFHAFSIFALTIALGAGIPADAAVRSLSMGLSGQDVRELQQALIAKGYLAASSATGYFGPLTNAAVKKFQCDSGILCSSTAAAGYGTYGPRTRAALQGAAGTGSSPTTSTPQSGTFEVSGWLPYWKDASSTADVMPRLSQLTEINPFGYTVRSTGTLFDAMEVDEPHWQTLIAEAKRQNVRVIPTVMWSDGATIHKILSNTETRIALEDEIAALVKEKGYDGIDIDFEGKRAETKDYFSTFLKGLYLRLGDKWLMCTIEARTPIDSRYSGTPPAGAGIYANDYAAINQYCDRVRIMTYDQGAIDVKLNRARAAPYIPLSDPAWVEKVIELTAQSIPKQKLVIGIPTYGYEYAVTPFSGFGYRYDKQWSFNQKYALDLAASLGITPVRNGAGEMSFIYKASAATTTSGGMDGSTTPMTNNPNVPSTLYEQKALASSIEPPFNIVWWSDSQAVKDKVDLAKRLGVRGVAVFKFDGGEDQGVWNFLKKE